MRALHYANTLSRRYTSIAYSLSFLARSIRVYYLLNNIAATPAHVTSPAQYHYPFIPFSWIFLYQYWWRWEIHWTRHWDGQMNIRAEGESRLEVSDMPMLFSLLFQLRPLPHAGCRLNFLSLSRRRGACFSALDTRIRHECSSSILVSYNSLRALPREGHRRLFYRFRF